MAVQYVNINGVKTPINQVRPDIRERVENPRKFKKKSTHGPSFKRAVKKQDARRKKNSKRALREASKEITRRRARGEKGIDSTIRVSGPSGGRAEVERNEAVSKGVRERNLAKQKQKEIETEQHVLKIKKQRDDFQKRKAIQEANRNQPVVQKETTPLDYPSKVKEQSTGPIGGAVDFVTSKLDEAAQYLNPKYKELVERERKEKAKEEKLTRDYERLLAKYNERPKVATSEQDYQEGLKEFNKLEKMYKELTKPEKVKETTQFGKLVEPVLDNLPQTQERIQKGIQEGRLNPIVGETANVGIGFGKELIGFAGTIDNVASQNLHKFVTGEAPTKREIKIPETAVTRSFGDVLTDKSGKEIIRNQEEYIKRFGVGSAIGEYATFGLGGIGVGTKGIGTAIKGVTKKVKPKQNVLIGKPPKPSGKTRPLDSPLESKPATRANEIKVGRGEDPIIGPSSKVKDSPLAKQSDVKPAKTKNQINVQTDINYKPTKRPNEIDLTDSAEVVVGPSSKVKDSPIARQSDVIPAKTTNTKKLVQRDPFFEPTRDSKTIFRAVDEDKTFYGFKKNQLRLGKSKDTGVTSAKGRELDTSITRTEDIKVIKTVDSDAFYKPSKRANEIDLTDKGTPVVGPSSKLTDSPLAKQSDVKLANLKPKKGPKVVETDPFFKPSRRANEISFADKGEPVVGPFSKIKDSPFAKQSDVKFAKTKNKVKAVERDPFMKAAPKRRIQLGKGEDPIIGPFSKISSKPAITIVGSIKLSKGFIPNKARTIGKGPQFKMFPKPTGTPKGFYRKFDEPKVSKGDSLVGKGGSVQIVKTKQVVKVTPLTKVKKKVVTKQSNPLVQKTKKKKRVLTTQENALTESYEIPFAESRPVASQAVRNIVLSRQELTVTSKQKQRGQQISLTAARVATKSQSQALRTNQKALSKLTSKTKLTSKATTKTRTRSIIIPKVKQVPKLKPALKPLLRERPRPTPNVPIPNITETTKPKQPQKLTERIPPKPPRTLLIFEGPKINKRSKKKKRKDKEAENADFLAASNPASVLGLSKRGDLTYGLKLVNNLVSKDIAQAKGKKPRKKKRSKGKGGVKSNTKKNIFGGSKRKASVF